MCSPKIRHIVNKMGFNVEFVKYESISKGRGKWRGKVI